MELIAVWRGGQDQLLRLGSRHLVTESSAVVLGGEDLRGDGGQLVDLSFVQH
jgi:hypothetical protein